MIEKKINIFCIGELEELHLELEEYFHLNSIEHYVIRDINIDQYIQQLEEKSITSTDIFLFDAVSFDSINVLKKLRMIYGNKYIVIVQRQSADFIERAQIKGFDIFYSKSSIDTLVYKMTNSYHTYKEEFKYKDISEIPLEEKGKIITIYSPKGGTGKTTLAVNMAIKYAQKGLKTLVVDFSQYSFISKLLDKEQKIGGLASVLAQLEKNEELKSNRDIEELLKSQIKQYEIERIKLDILAGAQPLKIDQLGAEGCRKIIRVLRQLNYDVILIDTSSELSIRNIVAFELSNNILLVTSPDVFSGFALIQCKELLNTLGLVSKCKLVVNNYEESLQFSYLDLEAELQIPNIAVLPSFKEIPYYNNIGKIIGLNKKSKMNAYYSKVAHAFIPVFTPLEIQTRRFIFR